MEPKDPVVPRWPLRFLQMFCPEYLLEEIEGDLFQQYARDLKMFGFRKARRRYIWNTLLFFRPGIVFRNRHTISILPMYMLLNYLKVATRVMWRSKTFSIINISGLALGIAGALLLFMWIDREFRYDQFHADKERIYKAWNRTTIEGELQCWDRTPRILAPTMVEEYSSVESAVSFANNDVAFLFRVGETRLMKNSGAYTDPDFLTMFSFPLLKGDKTTALRQPDGIVLTESFARQLFGDRDPFGETVNLSAEEHSFDFVVAGVLEDLPDETDFRFDYLISYVFLESLEGRDTHWGNSSLHTYVKLKPEGNVALFNEELRTIVSSHVSYENDTEVFLYPLTKMHLYARFENGVPSGGRIEIMRLMMILGGCLVIVACINFINLSTARAQKRSREVGVRKVTGAWRSSLVIQFLSESILMSIVAGLIAVALAAVLLPFFNELTGQNLSLRTQPLPFWGILIGGVLVTGLFSGLYPAIYLSSFKPVRVLKGKGDSSGGRSVFRKVLVTTQFGLAITLIFSTIVIRKQILHVQNREAGYDRNNLVYHFITGDLKKNYAAYRDEILQRGFAESITQTSAPITEAWSNTWAMEWEGKDPQTKQIIERYYVDQNFTRTAGLTLVAGRDMDLTKYPSDSTAVLLNEAAVRMMGFENPIGEIVKDGNIEWRVIGVVKDFVLSSPYHKITPMALMGSRGWFDVIHIRLTSDRPVRELIAGLETVFRKYNPEYPFYYQFVDDAYHKKFASLEKTLTITTVFAFLVVFIACLGLLGLSTYMIESRTKEIGVRKVLGGTVLGITRLLCVNALKPILLAIIIFSPLSWFAMSWWLQFSEYRISLDPGVLLLSWIAILLISLLTVSAQTVRAAMVNPVESLKSE